MKRYFAAFNPAISTVIFGIAGSFYVAFYFCKFMQASNIALHKSTLQCFLHFYFIGFKTSDAASFYQEQLVVFSVIRQHKFTCTVDLPRFT